MQADRPAEAQPAERPAEAPTAEQRPAEEQPVEAPTAEEQPVEAQAAEEQPVEAQAAEPPAVEQPPTQRPAVEEHAVEERLAERQSVGAQPVGQEPPEVDVDIHEGERQDGPSAAVLVTVAVVCLAAALGVGVLLLGDDVSGTQAAPPGQTAAPAATSGVDPNVTPPQPTGPDTPAPTTRPTAAPTAGPTATSAPFPDEFAITSAGIVPTGSVEPAEDAVIAPDQAVRLAVTYAGAAEGVELVADWTVAGEPYRTLDVLLSSSSSTHVFGAGPPADGFPEGEHTIDLVVDGEILDSVAFTVAG